MVRPPGNFLFERGIHAASETYMIDTKLRNALSGTSAFKITPARVFQTHELASFRNVGNFKIQQLYRSHMRSAHTGGPETIGFVSQNSFSNPYLVRSVITALPAAVGSFRRSPAHSEMASFRNRRAPAGMASFRSRRLCDTLMIKSFNLRSSAPRRQFPQKRSQPLYCNPSK
jgi:hypothetical protein